jgi:hypothetical protein
MTSRKEDVESSRLALFGASDLQSCQLCQIPGRLAHLFDPLFGMITRCHLIFSFSGQATGRNMEGASHQRTQTSYALRLHSGNYAPSSAQISLVFNAGQLLLPYSRPMRTEGQSNLFFDRGACAGALYASASSEVLYHRTRPVKAALPS